MKGGKVYRNLLSAPGTDPRGLAGTWLGLSGPGVSVSLEFASEGSVRRTVSPGQEPSTGRYTADGQGRLTITMGDDQRETGRYRIEASLLTLELEQGPRLLFRRAP
jgi:hypothetical protein